jgi:hypothetical protein
MSAIFKLDFSGNTDTEALALNSRSKDTIDLALLKTESLSHITGSDILASDTLSIIKNILGILFHSHNSISPLNHYYF